MRKRSNRLPVLVIVLAAFIFICIAGFLIWLKSSDSTTKFEKEKQQNKQKISTTTSTKTSQITEIIKTTENVETTTITGRIKYL